MGKEVKIGVAVGSCFILLAGVWFFGFYNSNPSPDGADVKEDAKPAAGSGANRSGTNAEQSRANADPLRRNLGLPSGRDAREPADGASKGEPVVGNRTGDPLRNTVGEAVGLKPRTGEPVKPGDPAKPVGPAGGKKHTVKAGDSLWGLAVQNYGDPSKIKLIEAANPDLKPNAPLRVGMSLVIPEAGAAAVKPGVPADPKPGVIADPKLPPTAGGADTYTVKAGDAFDGILREKYGSPLTHRQEILALNKDVLKNGPGALRPGMVLKLPAADKLKSAPKGGDPAKPLDLAKLPAKPDPLRSGKTGGETSTISQPGNRFLGID